MEYQYYNQKEKCFKPIPTKVYLCNLPICDQIPALRSEQLIVHRDIDYPKLWAVSHAETGTKITIGSTRQQAMQRAQEKLISFGNDKFLAAIVSKTKLSNLTKGE